MRRHEGLHLTAGGEKKEKEKFMQIVLGMKIALE